MKKKCKVKGQENWWKDWTLVHYHINIKERKSEIVPKILGSSVYQIIGKKFDDTRVESYFSEDERE